MINVLKIKDVIMKCNNYNNEHVIEFLYNRVYTNFLNRKELQTIKRHLKNIYELYHESSKVILYNNE